MNNQKTGIHTNTIWLTLIARLTGAWQVCTRTSCFNCKRTWGLWNRWIPLADRVHVFSHPCVDMPMPPGFRCAQRASLRGWLDEVGARTVPKSQTNSPLLDCILIEAFLLRIFLDAFFNTTLCNVSKWVLYGWLIHFLKMREDSRDIQEHHSVGISKIVRRLRTFVHQLGVVLALVGAVGDCSICISITSPNSNPCPTWNVNFVKIP